MDALNDIEKAEAYARALIDKAEREGKLAEFVKEFEERRKARMARTTTSWQL